MRESLPAARTVDPHRGEPESAVDVGDAPGSFVASMHYGHIAEQPHVQILGMRRGPLRWDPCHVGPVFGLPANVAVIVDVDPVVRKYPLEKVTRVASNS